MTCPRAPRAVASAAPTAPSPVSRSPLSPSDRLELVYARRPALFVVGYYAAMTLLGALFWQTTSPETHRTVLAAFAPALLGGATAVAAGGKANTLAAMFESAGDGVRVALPLEIIGATLGGFLLALPVAWTYMAVRERKGYRQSVVHTLVLLPVVVAGVVVLVKSSIALAFSLAGIVAAVRFRNTLDDSKDATFLFLAVAIGLAAGVQLDVALFLSVCFNLFALLLFYTDFARLPPQLEGERAQRQLERATAIANRTGMFVARVDEEVLRELGPEQLDALADRVRRRRVEIGGPGNGTASYDARIRLAVTDAEAVRPLVEPLLAVRCKRWALDRVVLPTPGGDEEVLYHVRWRKGIAPIDVLDALRDAGAPYVVHAEVC